MDEIRSEESTLSRMPDAPIDRARKKPTTAGDIEAALLARWPLSTGEAWDRGGLLVGDPAMPVERVAVALDVTVPHIRAAHAAGCQMLLTHHPAFLEAPTRFAPADSDVLVDGAFVHEAIRLGVALLNVHTALDVSFDARRALPEILRLDPVEVFEPSATDPDLGYGEVCACEEGMTLEHLAARVVSRLGSVPRVWGDMDKHLRRVVCTTGSASGMAARAARLGIDALVCGEVRYHEALSASHAGLAIVELGHDVSELPLCLALSRALVEAGFPSSDVVFLDSGAHWHLPQSTPMSRPEPAEHAANHDDHTSRFKREGGGR